MLGAKRSVEKDWQQGKMKSASRDCKQVKKGKDLEAEFLLQVGGRDCSVRSHTIFVKALQNRTVVWDQITLMVMSVSHRIHFSCNRTLTISIAKGL